ncbi:alcohol dehydrogenase [Nitrospira moscoviensis]|uniref:Alcohol dehydrogenase n=1 Tax=Nitrospira moscoviensis TaxID=42253 RepID=A0A0K2GAK0_NITMO|nr:alcohol dehydrogenase [Nitrospira moscoviensis]ALA57965.1 Alcohol dehydrogenase [Nitrospira moscoviensis]
MSRMTAVQIPSPGAAFEVVQREIPAPAPHQVRVKVEACGICHSDVFVKEGYWPGLHYPRITGHEVAGVIDDVGAGVTMWSKGQRVGVGWHGGHCGQCPPCRRGDFMGCRYFQVTGFQEDGGYAQYMIARQEAVAAIPDALSPVEAAPLLCAGVTTFNSLRHSGAQAGDLVAVQGLGGLGHLGIQFAGKMGFHTVAIGRGRDKESLALKLGAVRYLDATAVDVVKELTALGGASVILATAPDSKAMAALVDGLGVGGQLLVVGVSADAIDVTPVQLIMSRRSIRGWPSGTARDSEDTLNFCARTDIRPMVETLPLEQAASGYDRMVSGKARFRVVLTMD